MPASIVVLASLLVSPSVVPPTGVGFIDLGAGRFATAGTGRSLLVTPEGIDVVLGASSTPRADCGVEAGRASTLAVRWDRPGTAVHGEEARPGAVHLLRGADPARWRRGLAHYSRVRLEGIGAGVELIVGVAPGGVGLALALAIGAPRAVADGSIRLNLDGADDVALDRDGRLVASVGGRRAVLVAPTATLETADGGARALPCRFERGLDGGWSIRWEASGRPAPPPRSIGGGAVLRTSTLVGGSAGGVDDALDVPAVAVDDGPTGPRSIVVGSTTSLDFPVTRGAFDVVAGGGGTFDVFVAALGPDGTLEWATFLGGRGDDLGYGVAVGPAGGVALTGATVSPDFPVTPQAFDKAHGGAAATCRVADEQPFDAFVSVLAADGASLVYSTFLGGALVDAGIAIAVEPDGRVQVGGLTTANPGAGDLPVTAGALQPTYAGTDCSQSDGFVARLDPEAAGSASLLYCSYLGGPNQDAVRGLAIGPFGRTYVVLETNSPTMPVSAGAYQPFNAGPNGDGYVAKLDLERTGPAALRFGTFFGGARIDMALGVAPTAAGTAWVTGVTTAFGAGVGAPFPTTPGAPDATLDGPADAFVAHVDAAGRALLSSTLVGGSGFDHGRAIAVTRFGEPVVVGTTDSPDFPVTTDAFEPAPAGERDATLFRLAATGAAVRYGTRLGGSARDEATGLALDRAGTAHVAGTTLSTDFPSSSGVPLGGASDPFLSRLSPGPTTGRAVAAWSGGGEAVGLADDVAAVGVPDALAGSGVVVVRRRTAAGWTDHAVLMRASAAPGDGLGGALAIDAGGGVVVAGAPAAGAGRGAVSVFVASGASWTEIALAPAGGRAGDAFGSAVAVADGRLFVGAPGTDVGGAVDAGAVFVFEPAGGALVETATLSLPSPSSGDRFGAAVASIGDTLVVGAPGVDVAAPDAGAVFRFAPGEANGWIPLGPLPADGAAAGDACGSAVAGDGAWLAVGAPGRDALGAADVGEVRVFAVGPAGPSEAARLALDVRPPHARFGAAVAVDGDRIVVGAPGDDAGERAAGSVSTFAFEEGAWRATGRLSGGGAAAGDAAGTAVALAGATVLAGAPGAALGAGRVDVLTLADGIETYGAGCPGGGGVAPTLAAVGVSGPGGAVAMHVADGPPGATVLLRFGSGRAATEVAPGCAFLLGGALPAGVGPLPLDASGSLSIAGAIPAGLPAATLTVQAFLGDPSAPPGWSATNGLEMVIE